MFGLPVITAYTGGGALPPGEVVGADPWDDADDATYARGAYTGGFHHITASIAPTTVAADATFVFRASATLDAGGSMRFVANLYPPGWESGDPGEPALNFTAGPSSTYVAIPVADGLPQDIPVTVVDWVTGTPTSAAEIEAYFAAGGTLLIQPSGALGGTGTVTIHRIGIPVVDEEVVYRRIYPRDDRRNWPPPKAYSRGNRRGGGYL